jgi:hypothetical protein
MEKNVEKRLREKTRKELRGFAFKFISPGTTGVPDRLVLVPWRRFYLVELKFGKNGLSPRQKIIQKALGLIGIKVYVLYSNKDVDDFIEFVKGEQMFD